MPNDPNRRKILPPISLEESYLLCRDLCHRELGDYRFVVSNVNREDQRHVMAVAAVAARTARLCDIHIARAARLELLDDIREAMRNNFMEEESTDQFAALLDTVKRFRIPQQYVHDIVAAADWCLRLDTFKSFDDWLQFGYRLGGGTVLSLVPVFGVHHAGYEDAAIKCGQAIWLTWLLDNIGGEIQQLEYFLPSDELAEQGVDLTLHNPLEPAPELLQMIQLLASRIGHLYQDGGTLVSHLELDGQRTLKTILGLFWHRLEAIKDAPGSILTLGRDTTRRPGFRDRFRHLMGFEPKLPFLGSESGNH